MLTDERQEELDEETTTETVENATSAAPAPAGRALSWETLAVIPLLLILLLGAYFRFTGLDWDDAYHLHPDERFLTDVAGLLQPTDPLTYLKTSESPLNPYNFGKNFYVYGNFPMTVTRLVAEWVDKGCQNFQELALCAGRRFIFYDGIHLAGRALSALVDLVSIVFTFLIGRRLYNWPAGLIGALLLALAVLPIQQSHYFTMDNWAATLTTLAMYAAVRAAGLGEEPQARPKKRWWLLFGLGLGLAVASRINMAPLAGMAVVAAGVWLARRAQLHPGSQDWRYLLTGAGSMDLQRAMLGVFLAAIVSFATFRLAQPYAFSDRQLLCSTELTELGLPPAGDQDPCQTLQTATGRQPGFLESLVASTIGFNPQWRANMAEIQALQSPEASFPPALQWVNRTPILFPLINIVFWGMGLTAGVAAWLGFLWALWRIIRARPEWMAHALPVAWSGFYFLFMATRWVKSIRYFLPIYPFLLLLAGWALVELWRRAGRRGESGGPAFTWQRAAVAGLALLVIVPTFLWANAFVDIYRNPVTRVRASAWMFEHVRSGATLLYELNGETREAQLPLRDFEFQPGGTPLTLNFELPEGGVATALRFNYLSDPSGGTSDGQSLDLLLVERSSTRTLAESSQRFDLAGGRRQEVVIDLPDIPLTAETGYFIIAQANEGGPFLAGTSALANEHWDDSLPVRFEGQDPYGAYYNGLSEGLVPITYPDSEDKRQSFYRWLEESDYIVLSSQRALWSVPRLPLTYPLTTRYYDALFSGELGFELIGQFHADLHVGPLYISDVGGAFNWGAPPEVGWPPPGTLAAEEAFSVYDHPPVWLFAKTDDYNLAKAEQVLGSVDLSNVVVMSPGQATQARNGLMLSEEAEAVQQANGTFSRMFAVDGFLSRNPGLAAVVWWLAVIGLGWLAFPIAFVVFRGLPDRGYPLARILSLLLLSYFGWLMASLRLLPHTRGTLALGLLLMALVSLAIAWQRRQEMLSFVQQNLRLIGFVEFAGILFYLLFILVRLGNPDLWDVIWGGEKPMDFSYFNAILKSTVFPPYDPWFAGGYINYYYYGFVYVGSITKLLGIVPAVAYNLIVPMLFSFTGLGAFSLAYNLVAGKEIRAWKRLELGGVAPLATRAVTAGLVAASLCILLGNLAQVGVMLGAWHKASDSTINTGIGLVDTAVRTLDGGLDLILTDKTAPLYPGDWFWLASRAINYRPGEAQPITEFPFFTFLYADLHAHMIALPLTLLALGWSISLALQSAGIGDAQGSSLGLGDEVNKNPLIPQSSQGKIEIPLRWFVGGLAIGVLRATNTWDLPTYLFLGVLAITFYTYRQHGRLGLRMVGEAGLYATALVILAVVTFLPFAENYGVAYASFSLWPGSYTELKNYLAVYGLFLFFVLTHLAREFRAWSRTWTQAGLARLEPVGLPLLLALAAYVLLIFVVLVKGYWVAPVVLTLVILAGILGLRPGLSTPRRVALILISSALGLSLLVEFIVLDGDVGRMNTVFKFYLQVWIMLSVVSGAAAAWAWPAVKARPRLRRAWRLALALLVAAAALYPLLATKAKWDTRMSPYAPMTLDGMAFMEVTTYNDRGQTVELDYDYDALQWIQRNIEGSPVIAEANDGTAYRSVGNRVAMYTGLPTIIGWDWHQRQQRAVVPGAMVPNRITDITNLYNTLDTAEALAIIEKYEVKYIYAGQLEWIYYNPEGLLKFDRMVEQGLLREVYRNGGVSIYEVQ
ncbi:MAG: DUF2298 domain-containing protein [Chloroflexi bacterium]|nr:DUF2298 domain-containing protein [Chloroflexota bacterium]MCI0578702.1 DUF2298 domain-containing protein [Chloroflexota bacterium]MCI0648362.1 DUF2298 domain-containing protein [Chloroflexota bacterium]MCI0730941.1 DUF2298 domain-containing protein [Chloroflexota bacterium]